MIPTTQSESDEKTKTIAKLEDEVKYQQKGKRRDHTTKKSAATAAPQQSSPPPPALPLASPCQQSSSADLPELEQSSDRRPASECPDQVASSADRQNTVDDTAASKSENQSWIFKVKYTL